MFTIAKVFEDERLVFGFANVAVRVDGRLLEDSHGEVIDPGDLEKAAYAFVLHHGDANENHAGPVVGRVVESAMLTPEKMRAMFADGRGGLTISDAAFAEVAKAMQGRWWVGFQVEPASFARVKSGEFRMFSIEGVGERVEL